LKEIARNQINKWRGLVVSHPVGREIFGFLDGVAGGYVRDHGLMYAGAIAFFLLLSMIPLVVLFASAAGFFISFIAGADDTQATQEMVKELVVYVRNVIPYLSDSFEADITRIVTARSELGAVSGFGLLIAASQVFRAIEFAFARIFRRRQQLKNAEKPRPAVLSKLIFGTFLFAVVGVFVGSRWILGDVLLLLQEHWGFLRHLGIDPERLSVFFGGNLFVNFAIVGAYTLILQVFSIRHIHWRFCVFGGIIFWVGVQLIHWGFDIYLSDFSEMGALYGGLSALMTVVIWLFLMATVFLVSAHVVRVLSKRAMYNSYDFEEQAIEV
jgi:membrane protein